MKKYFDALKKCPLFYQVEEESLSALLGCLGAFVKSYNKKDTIISEGDSADFIGIVLSGAAQVMQYDYYGNRSIVSDVSESQLFCESFACAGEKEIPVDVVAVQDSEIMFITGERVMNSCCNACEFHRKIIYNMMKNMANKNIMFHQKIQITSKRTTREKLLTYLSNESKRIGSKSFTIPFNRQELADYLEVDRSGLSVEIGKLKNEGILDSYKNSFKML